MDFKPMNALKYIFMFLVLAFSGLMLHAGDESSRSSVRFAYDVDFEMNFDNREFYKSAFSRSMTIFGARLTPSVGLDVVSRPDTRHRVIAGLDVMKDFGSPKSDVSDHLQELTLYYNLEKRLGGGRADMTIYAGIFPRKMMSDRYSTAFFSDSLTFYDNNLEGLLIKFRRPKAEFEVGCDWMGQIGQNQRERFMVFSSGEGEVAPFLTLGYAGYMYHFACSEEVTGVVDNILVNPYARFTFGHMMGLQAFDLRFGWLQGMQNDRKHVGTYTFPCGGEFDLEVRHWNFGLRNSLFYGMDMMPYYNNLDSGSYKYGNILYPGDPFYRIHDDGKTGPGSYDRLEFFWEPKVGEYLKIKVGALFHFHDFRYSGCRQMVRLDFNLHSLLNRKR